MILDTLKNHLILAFQKPLPGFFIQKTMAAKSKNDHLYSQKNESVRLGAVLISFYEKKGEVFFTLIKRAEYNGVHARQIAIPGGKKERQETYEQTAIREAYEEVGIAPSSVTILGLLTPLAITVSHFRIQPVVAFLSKKPTYNVDSAEVAYVIEVPLKQLLDSDCLKKRALKLPNGREVMAPYFALENEIVWGATAMILAELKYMILN